jgi:hypothetical protein
MLADEHLAHKLSRVEAGSDRTAHQLEDDGQRIEGHQAIREHIESVVREREHWGRFQGDVCFDYGDDTGLSGE